MIKPAGPVRQIIASAARLANGFIAARRGAAAVEFALSSLWLFLFMFAIINLGYLGFSLGALQHTVEGAARRAAVQASANLAGYNPNSSTCPSTGTTGAIAGYFNSLRSSVVPTAANLTTFSATWVSNSASADDTPLNVSLPTSYLILTAQYKWTPIGFPKYLMGVNLGITTVSFVMGTNGNVTC